MNKHKFTFPFYFFCFVSGLTSQSSIFLNKKIDWYISSERLENHFGTQTQFHFKEAIYDLQCGDVPKYSIRIKIPHKTIPFVQIKNIQFENLSHPFKNKECIKSFIDPYISVSDEKNQSFAGINFIPIINQGGVLKKIISFELEVNFKSQSLGYQKSGPTFKNKSVLAEGKFYKIALNKSDIYSLDYSFFNDTLGINTANINLDQIQIFTHPEGKLPQDLSTARTDDLEEIPLYIIAGNDHILNPGDQVLFYGPGPNRTNPIELNIYDVNNYAFVRLNFENGKRIEKLGLNGLADHVSTTYDFTQRHELNQVNLLGDFISTSGSGQQWYGEIFTNQRTQDFSSSFNFDDLSFEDHLHFEMKFAGRSKQLTEVNLNILDKSYIKTIGTSNTGDVESIYARIATISDSTQVNQTNIPIEISHLRMAENSEGWLDYLEFKGRKLAIYRGEPILLADEQATDFEIAQFDINNISNELKIWDITNPFDLKEMVLNVESQIGSFRYRPNVSKYFILFDPVQEFSRPRFVSEIANQNLHAVDDLDMIILYHPDFVEAAERLAKHRNEHDGLSVRSLDINLIYNEFSSDKHDPTAIRDFAKMIYERDPDFNYLLLIGDGSYDHRGVVPKQNNESFIPAFETEESLHPLNAFPSDDYFGLLSDNEGGNLKGALDIAIGRLPVKTKEEANTVVNKLIKYDTDRNALGEWRNRLAFLADDEDSNRHINDTEKVSVKIKDNFPIFNQEKIYFDSFVQESTPGGARYPDANEKFNQEIFKGLLLVTYLGHGGPKGWSQERVLKIADINSWKNKDKMPLIITATCSFTGFDDPAILTAGEQSILKEDGGAIGLFSTVRAVFASQNFRLTNSVYDTIFTQPNGDFMRIGEILRRAKNNTSADTSNVNARKFLLIGDPSMKLALPKYNVSTTLVNGRAATDIDTLSALEKVQISGAVTDKQGNIKTDFEGIISIVVFDKPTAQQTLVNDNSSRQKSFEVQRNVIFNGKATVTNGLFSFSFVVPIDINYEFGKGKISYYASSNDQLDASGYFDNFIVGGTASNTLIDDQGPNIQLFMNDESFVFGGITDANPILIAKLADDNGINVSGNSIGHDVTAVLNQNSQNTLILNEFYTAQLDDFTQGAVRFPLNDLEEGRHEIKVKAFDVANNAGEAFTEFLVVHDLKSGIERLINYPNPFTTKTSFSFEQNLVNVSLDIQLDIYTISGKLVKTIQANKFTNGYRVDGIDWDGKDDYGKSLGRGIYLYKVKIFNPELNISKESAFQKLVLLN